MYSISPENTRKCEELLAYLCIFRSANKLVLENGNEVPKLINCLLFTKLS